MIENNAMIKNQETKHFEKNGPGEKNLNKHYSSHVCNNSMKHDFFAVGIGASAGGLSALRDFFLPIPPDTGIAYIVVTHLKKDYKSQLDQLLIPYTSLPVCRLTSNSRLRPDHIYVLPEDRMVSLKGGILTIRKRYENELVNNAVDIFFSSLANDFAEKAVGIVLSGCGSDGLQGSKQIKDNGGFVMVQSPESSQFRGMPETIINEDHPIMNAAPAKLAAELLRRVA